MKIICGLGNPGREYERHRHNVGFMVVDQLAAKLKAPFSTNKWEAEIAQATMAGEKVLLVKPMTFMNLSGTALGQVARFYKVSAADTLVVHDELDLPFGSLMLKQGGGSGGHNGLNSMKEHWGEDNFARLRFGIGKPAQGPGGAAAPAKDRVVGHVLGDFSSAETAELAALIDASVAACQTWARDGIQKAMNSHNRKAKPAQAAK